jgi:hypothetical protein
MKSRLGRGRHVQLSGNTLSGPPFLSGWFDHVAVASSRHRAILQLADGGELAGEPNSDREESNRNNQAGDRSAPAVAWFRLGHWIVLCDHETAVAAHTITVLRPSDSLQVAWSYANVMSRRLNAADAGAGRHDCHVLALPFGAEH